MNDLVQLHFNDAEKNAVDTALNQIESTIAAKCRNLTPDERMQLGSVNEHNKLLINKSRDYRLTQPGMSSPDVNWAEFEADWQDRFFLETRMQRLLTIFEMMGDTKILHDYDNYQNALVDHRYTRYKAETEAGGGYTTKYHEMKQFFPNTGTTKGSDNSTGSSSA
jgi:hypothetical protein